MSFFGFLRKWLLLDWLLGDDDDNKSPASSAPSAPECGSDVEDAHCVRIQSLESRIAELEKQQDRCDVLSDRYDDLQDEIDELQDEIDDLQDELDDMDDDL